MCWESDPFSVPPCSPLGQATVTSVLDSCSSFLKSLSCFARSLPQDTLQYSSQSGPFQMKSDRGYPFARNPIMASVVLTVRHKAINVAFKALEEPTSVTSPSSSVVPFAHSLLLHGPPCHFWATIYPRYLEQCLVQSKGSANICCRVVWITHPQRGLQGL